MSLYDKLFTCVNDTSNKLITGVIVTGKKFIGGNNDTGVDNSDEHSCNNFSFPTKIIVKSNPTASQQNMKILTLSNFFSFIAGVVVNGD